LTKKAKKGVFKGHKKAQIGDLLKSVVKTEAKREQKWVTNGAKNPAGRFGRGHSSGSVQFLLFGLNHSGSNF
jgi:hypothetical protein